MSEKNRKNLEDMYKVFVAVGITAIGFFLSVTYAKIENNQTEIISILQRIERNDAVIESLQDRINSAEQDIEGLEKLNVMQQQKITEFYQEYTPALEHAKKLAK